MTTCKALIFSACLAFASCASGPVTSSAKADNAARSAAEPAAVDATTAAGFSELFRRAIAKRAPTSDLVAVPPLAFDVALSGERQRINLDRYYDACRAAPDRCEQLADEYAGLSLATIREMDTSSFNDLATLRAVIRHSSYARDLTNHAASTGSKALLIVEPWVADMVQLFVFDLPTSMRFVTTGDLERLELTQEALTERARANTAAMIGLPDKVAPPDASGIGIINLGHAYEASYALQHGAWKDVAERMKGPLLVVIPTTDLFIYGDGGVAQVPQILASAGAVTQQKSTSHSVSTVVLEWTPSGWLPRVVAKATPDDCRRSCENVVTVVRAEVVEHDKKKLIKLDDRQRIEVDAITETQLTKLRGKCEADCNDNATKTQADCLASVKATSELNRCR